MQPLTVQTFNARLNMLQNTSAVGFAACLKSVQGKTLKSVIFFNFSNFQLASELPSCYKVTAAAGFATCLKAATKQKAFGTLTKE